MRLNFCLQIVKCIRHLNLKGYFYFQAKSVEHKAIVEGIKENGESDSDRVIRSVLAARHARELRDLDKQAAAKKKIMVDDAMQKVAEKFERQREEMQRMHEAELDSLQVIIYLLELLKLPGTAETLGEISGGRGL